MHARVRLCTQRGSCVSRALSWTLAPATVGGKRGTWESQRAHSAPLRSLRTGGWGESWSESTGRRAGRAASRRRAGSPPSVLRRPSGPAHSGGPPLAGFSRSGGDPRLALPGTRPGPRCSQPSGQPLCPVGVTRRVDRSVCRCQSCQWWAAPLRPAVSLLLPCPWGLPVSSPVMGGLSVVAPRALSVLPHTFWRPVLGTEISRVSVSSRRTDTCVSRPNSCCL